MHFNQTLIRIAICIFANFISFMTFAQSYIIVGHKTVCPTSDNVVYNIRTDDTLVWTVSRGRFANGSTTITTQGSNLHTVSVRWDHVTANPDNTMPRGVIEARKRNGGANDWGRDTVVILSVRGWRTNVKIDNGDENPGFYYFPYGSAASVLVSASEFVPNTTDHKIMQNQWILPADLTSSPPRIPDQEFLAETIRISPTSACSPINSTIRVRAENSPCYHNLAVNDRYGLYRDIFIRRSRPTPTIHPLTTTVPWGVPTPITFTAQGTPTAERYEWEVSGGFIQTGALTTTTPVLQLIHSGSGRGTVSVTAVYCGDKRSVTTAPINIDVDPVTIPRISGLPTLCPGFSTNFSVQNPPNGASVHWTTGRGLAIQGANDQAIVSVRNTGGQEFIPLESTELESESTTIAEIPMKVPAEPANSWIRATININGQVHILQHDLTVNRISLGPIQGPNPLGGFQPGTAYRFTCNHDHPDFLLWDAGPGQAMGGAISNTEGNIRFVSTGLYTVTASITNACGTSSRQTTVYVTSAIGCRCGFSPPGAFRPCPRCEIALFCTICDGVGCFQCNPHCVMCGGGGCPFCRGFGIFSPNPVSNILTIDLTQQPGNSTDNQPNSEIIFNIRLINSQGTIVRQQQTPVATIQFDVSNLPEGTYYLHIEHNGQIEKHQIIIQRN